MIHVPTHVPLPQMDAVSEPFWSACAERRLVVQHCRACGSFQYPPRLFCRNCRGAEFDWPQSNGSGRIYTYTVVHHAPSAELRDQIPYVVAAVKLEDCGGVLVISNLVGESASGVTVDRAVRLRWDNDAGLWLPRFELV